MKRSRGESPLRDPEALLSRSGLRPDRRRDQHFLTDGRVLDRVVEYADGFDREHVLEIGPGTGALTDRLLHVASTVTAIERDRDLVDFLGKEFDTAIEDDRLQLVHGDALEVPLPPYTTSVSNLPYGASSEILFRLLPRERPLVIMVQREFADRLVAEPGTPDYGRLTVTAGHYAEVELLETVPPSVFTPRPAVESAVVRTTPRTPTYTVGDESAFLALVTAVFTQRRKTMRNAIRNTTHISGIDDPEAVIEAADPDAMAARPGELDPAEFAAIAGLATGPGERT